MKKFFTKLLNWEGSRKSNWTKAMETQDLNEDERKKMTDEAKESLKKEHTPAENRQESAKEEVKLMNFTEQKENFAKSAFRADQKDQERMTREHNQQIMAGRDKKYVSERTIPDEGEILGPSMSEPNQEEK
ncbi:MAG: hypothetical protein HYT64_00190 [Candidatus Yanofskybacteria bacterium]|nr:hypothetical protein [Candidatus Yanofskybacteria bacterium]